MKIDFTGRYVLVTGSTSGIGFATVKDFLEAGRKGTDLFFDLR